MQLFNWSLVLGLMKISYKISGIILLVTILTSLLVSLLAFKIQKTTLQNHIYSQLEAVAEAKESTIMRIIESRKEILSFLTRNPFLLREFFRIMTDHPESDVSRLRSVLENYSVSIPSFRNIHLLNRDGKILVSNKKSFEGQDWSHTEAFRDAESGKRSMNGLHIEDGRLYIYLSAPVRYNGRYMGVLIIEREASDILSITNDYTGLGKTGETILAKRYGDSAVFLTPLRFDRNAALKRKLFAGDSSYIINQVLYGRQGFFLSGKDYRDVNVAASARFIPETGWAVVAKMDVDEILMPVSRMRNFILALDAGAIIFSAAIALLLGRSLARPIVELQQAASELEAGNLAKRVEVSSGDEIGKLGESFNRMAGKLQKKIGDLDKFAYIVSHDLKAPLASLEPLLQMIRKEQLEKGSAEESVKMTDMCLVKVGQMNRIIYSILQTAKGEKMIKEVIDTGELVRETIAMLEIPPHIKVRAQKNMPLVFYHRTSLMQVFQNLIGNSVKYMDKDQGLITVGSSRQGNFHNFCIADNGPGVPQEDHEKIFGLFETAGEGAVKGTGIGLSIVKKIVEDNGGLIWFNSVRGQGTAFYFTIPQV